MRNYRSLNVWQSSHQFVLQVYPITQSFPQEERYGLTQQIRRAASSIPANIAEGCGRDTDPDFVRFLTIASGSASELDYHLLLAHELRFLSDQCYATLAEQLTTIRRMLTALIRQRQKQRNPNP